LKKQFKKRLNTERKPRAEEFAAGTCKLPAAYPGVGLRFEFDGLDFVHVAPSPGFAGLNGSHQGVLTPVKVLGGVFVFR
jgi:hypothetical protein